MDGTWSLFSTSLESLRTCYQPILVTVFRVRTQDKGRTGFTYWIAVFPIFVSSSLLRAPLLPDTASIPSPQKNLVEN